MNKFYNIVSKIIVLIIVLAIIAFTLSNSYFSKGLDKLAYVVALGIDVGKSNTLKLSIQLAKPESGSSSSSTQSTSTVIDSVECSTIESGLNLFNSYISRDINLSHCTIIAISEAVAAKGISEYVYGLSNNVEVSSHANILITKCEANKFLEMTKPVLENFPARYYEIVNTTNKVTGYTMPDSVMDFFSDDIDTFKEPSTVLSNINNGSTHSDNISGSFTNKDSSYKAGQTPITSTNNVENMGIAIFKNGKLVGELNALESICHMIVSGNLKYCNVQIKNPEKDNDEIDIKVKLPNQPKCNLRFINGNAYISENINLDIEILTANSGETKYSNNGASSVLKEEINEYFEKLISNYLYKVAKVYDSDIDGFGKYAIKYFPTIDKWNQYNWLSNFENSFFKVKVNSQIRSSASLSNS